LDIFGVLGNKNTHVSKEIPFGVGVQISWVFLALDFIAQAFVLVV
jgi:hypothetical protein